jgi:hypothetical protein
MYKSPSVSRSVLFRPKAVRKDQGGAFALLRVTAVGHEGSVYTVQGDGEAPAHDAFRRVAGAEGSRGFGGDAEICNARMVGFEVRKGLK